MPPVESPLPFPPGVILRLGTSADFPQLAAFHTETTPEHPVTVTTLERFQASLRPTDPFLLVMAVRDKKLVGVSEVSPSALDNHPGWLGLEVTVARGEEAGPLPVPLLALAEHQARQAGAHTFTTVVHEGDWRQGFFEAHGYAEHDRMWMSTLDLHALNFSAFAQEEETASATGVRVRPLSELGSWDEAHRRQLYALIAGVLQDVPSATPVSVYPFEEWDRRYGQKIDHPEGLMVAVAPNGDWVGLSELYREDPGQPDTLRIGLTGVRRDWRGHRLGLALKLAASRSALARGYRYAKTGNHSSNRPMLAINEAMGFVREAARITLNKSTS